MGAGIVLIALLQAAQGPGGGEASRGGIRVWLESGPPERCVDVLFVGDGYQAADLEQGRYWKDVGEAADRLFGTAPFSWYRSSFNVRALFLESRDAGCDRGPADEVDTSFDTTIDVHRGDTKGEKFFLLRAREELARRLEDARDTDLVLVIVNCPWRAVGGDTLVRPGRSSADIPLKDGRPALEDVYVPVLTFSAHDPAAFDMALHALGHSMGGLGDECSKDPVFCPTPAGLHALPPGGSNVKSSPDGSAATVRDDLPWDHFRRLADGKKLDWMLEGAGRRETGVFRPWSRCRMRDPDSPFCPVCTEELAKAIQSLCGREWKDEDFHREHPLKLWKK